MTTTTTPPRRSKLRTSLQRIRNEPGLGRNVVIVLVLLALALVTGGIILGNQRFTLPWTDRYVVHAAFEASPGISPGNGQEVRVAGVIVGQIAEAEIGPDGKARLELDMEPGTQVYDNARLVLRPKSPLNEMYVEIAPGGPPGRLVPSGGDLPVTNTDRPVQVDEVLAHLDGEARRGLTQLLAESDVALASAPQALPGGLDATAGVTEKLQPVVTQLDQRRETLRRLVTALGQISTAVGANDSRLTDLAGSLQTTLSALAENDQPLDSALGQLPDLTAQLRAATTEVQGLADQLDPTLRNVQAASNDLPEALSRLEGTVHQLDATIDVAAPVVQKATPVVGDLRPYVADLNRALPSLERTTSQLEPFTGTLLDYLPDVGAFFVNTRDIVSLRDGNGGILRGILTFNPETLLPPPANLVGTAGGPITGPLGPSDEPVPAPVVGQALDQVPSPLVGSR
ncbi:MlaD family protein [Pseudonocardia sp. RS11V-5]|uniref:MlaD family protein n=1 Tax=Pseudonocardia terrae TaxID=2905831 RepID=UPI001E30250E|nr:MlaD family protein [Pseudonocardia terrae]MCE3554469.1 MlaD family protein [Pseudonocardia terrae]